MSWMWPRTASGPAPSTTTSPRSSSSIFQSFVGTTSIVAYPVSAALPVDRVVQVDISRFEAELGGNVELSAQWIIFGDGGRSYVQVNGGSYTASTGNGDYRSIAAAMSQALGDLSRDIATSLASASSRPKPSS